MREEEIRGKKKKENRRKAAKRWISFACVLPETWTILASGRETSLDPACCLSQRRESRKGVQNWTWWSPPLPPWSSPCPDQEIGII